MKKKLLGAILLSGMLFFSNNAAHAASLYVSNSNAGDTYTGKVGDVFSLDIFLDMEGAAPVWDNLSLELTITPADLKTSPTGLIFDEVATNVVFWGPPPSGGAIPRPSDGLGMRDSDADLLIYYSPLIPGALPKLQTGKVATIDGLTLNDIGTWTVALTGTLYQGSADVGQPNFFAATVAALASTPPPVDPPPVPVPGALWLLGSGCAGLVAMKRKRS